MSKVIDLDAVPNQELSVRLDGKRYAIRIVDVGDVMAVTIERDGVVVCQNVRAVAGFPLLYYRYQEDDSGNFIFTTDGDEIPHWEKFGITQELIYTSNAELTAIRNDAAA